MQKRKKVTFSEEELDFGSDINVSDFSIKRQYVLDVMMESTNRFHGDVTSIPSVLVKYLKDTELKVFVYIMAQLKNNNACTARRGALAKDMGVSVVTVSNAMSSLEKMGIIKQERRGMRMQKTINFENIQVLEDLLKDRLPGAAATMRKLMGTRNITNPTELALQTLNLQYTLKTGVEAEEYEFN